MYWDALGRSWHLCIFGTISNSFWILLPPANKVCEGNVFTGVCLSTGGHASWRGGMFGERGHGWWKGGMCGKGGHVWQSWGMHGEGGMHGKGGHLWQRGACLVKGDMHGRGYVCGRGMCGRGCAWQGGHACMRDSYWTGWYTSYWNAFFLRYVSKHF